MKILHFRLLPWILATSLLAVACGSRTGSDPSDQATQRASSTPSVDVVPVVSQKLATTRKLPGELAPYLVVAVYPKVTGFLTWINVDRGSWVQKGEKIATLVAPELVAQRAEAYFKLQAAESALAAAEAKFAADQGTYERLKKAAEVPGVVAKNDLLLAQKAAEADQAQVTAHMHSVSAAKDALQAIAQLESYLEIYSPFDGIVTDRHAHPGALLGPVGGHGGDIPLVRIQTLAHLRLIIPVPEAFLAGIQEGKSVDFTVPAYPGKVFQAPIARISHAVDIKTRTMPVELDVTNADHRLDPGTYAQVLWPVERPYATLFVPTTAIASNLQRTFVIRVRNGKTEWVDVKTGVALDKLIEVFGDLNAGDHIVARATDELQPGTSVLAKTTEDGNSTKPK